MRGEIGYIVKELGKEERSSTCGRGHSTGGKLCGGDRYEDELSSFPLIN